MRQEYYVLSARDKRLGTSDDFAELLGQNHVALAKAEVLNALFVVLLQHHLGTSGFRPVGGINDDGFKVGG